MTVILDRLLTQWLRKYHKASHVGIILLRQLFGQRLSLKLNYSYLVYLWYYYLAEYE